MKKILIGIPVKNTGKYLHNLFDQIEKLDYNKSLISVVLLEGDSTDDSYNICKTIALTKLGFREISVMKLDLGYDLLHNFDRYNSDKFPKRIENLVITRNFIVDNYLKDNDYLWWVDSDFEYIPSDTVNKFIECDKDIVIPILTHDSWGYHDCGSVVFEGDKQHRFQYINTGENLIKLDRSDTHCFIKANVFRDMRYKYVEGEYIDGCGRVQTCWSDGTYLSMEAVKRGLGLYGAKHIIIKHHNI